MTEKHRGFTLIELVVVLAIIAILAAVLIPGLMAYYRSYKLVQYNDFAKTIFLSAQTWLTEAKTSGQLEKLNDENGQAVTSGMVSGEYFGGSDTAALRYLRVSKGEGPDDNWLYTILEDLVYDKSVLNQSICLEYSTDGQVYSVSYSEEAESFHYAGESPASSGGVSIEDRSPETREILRFGYYSADSLGGLNTNTRLDDSKVELVNDERLYLMWSDAQPAGESMLADITYVISLRDAGTNEEYLKLKIPVRGVRAENPNSANFGTVSSYFVSCAAAYQRDGSAVTEQKNCWVASRLDDKGKNNYILVLDAIDTTTGHPYSVTQNYAMLPQGEIYAAVSAEAPGYAPNSEATSNREHTLFGETGGGKTGLSKMRHLYNLRYAQGTKDVTFELQADLDWAQAVSARAVVNGGKILSTAEEPGNLFETLSFRGGDGGTAVPFSGTFLGRAHKISGLTIVKTDLANPWVGLFAENEGKLQDFTLETKSVTSEGPAGEPDTATGGVAAVNRGSVSGVTFSGTVSGGDRTGGVVGLNEGAGRLEDCATSGGTVTGGKFVGGIVGFNTAAGQSVLENFVNEADVLGEEYVGGITGVNGALNADEDLSTTRIENCVNRGGVTAGVAYGGGIVGWNSGTIVDCSSEFGEGMTDASAMALLEKLKKSATGDYIGGIAGYNSGTIQGRSADRPSVSNAVVAGRNYVGGVAGHNDGEGNVKNYQVVGGYIQAGGNFAGGFFGLNTSAVQGSSGGNITMDLIANPNYVTGRYYVGGAIGANLVSKKVSTVTFVVNSRLSQEEGVRHQVVGAAFAGGLVGTNEFYVVNQNQLEKTLREMAGRDAFSYEYGDNGTGGTDKGRVVIKNSTNFMDVTADRYVGGIIGCNGSDSTLEIDTCINNGALSVDTAANQSRPQVGSYYIGGITGRNSASGTISQSANNGRVESLSTYTGGIVEVNDGVIRQCSSQGQVVSRKSNVGGIVGLNETGGTVTDCVFQGTVSLISGVDNIGGVVGENRGSVENARLEGGTVKGSGKYVGGIAGVNSGSMSGSVNRAGAAVQGDTYVGGFVGLNRGTGTLEGLQNYARVTGTNYVGGIVGIHEGDTIKNCANYGTVSCTETALTTYVGGITGVNAEGKKIADSINVGTVESQGLYAGGIVSVNEGEIESCRDWDDAGNTGTVRGKVHAGGLVGLHREGAEVSHAWGREQYIRGTVVNTGSWGEVGGLWGVNENQTTISGYTFQGTVRTESSTGDQNVGGFVGSLNEYQYVSDCKVDGGAVSGAGGNTGGAVGKNQGGIVSNITISGEVSVSGGASSGGFVGGFIGRNIYSDAWALKQRFFDLTVSSGASLSVTGNSTTRTLSATGTGGLVGGLTGEQESALTFADHTMGNNVSVRADCNAGGFFGLVSIKGAGFTMDSCINRARVGGKNLADRDATGGLIGTLQLPAGSGAETLYRLMDCENQGEITGGGNRTGGLVGFADAGAPGTIQIADGQNSAAISAAPGAGMVGGLVGYARTVEGRGSVTISKGRNSGKITGTAGSNNEDFGGIAGALNGGGVTVANCENSGDIAGGSYATGGIVGGMHHGRSGDRDPGTNAASVKNCVNTGKVTGAAYVGGIVGMTEQGGEILACTAAEGSTVSGKSQVGGILGAAWTYRWGAREPLSRGTAVRDCESLAYIENTQSGGSDFGGIVGRIEPTTDSFMTVVEGCTFGREDRADTDAGFGRLLGGYVGGIVGGAKSAEIRNCQNYVDITQTEGSSANFARAGGILGGTYNVSSARTTVARCRNGGDLLLSGDGLSHNSVGGVVGSFEGGTNEVTDSKNEGKVQARSAVGGILGNSGAGAVTTAVTFCENFPEAEVLATNSQAGGIAGNMTGGGSIYQSSNSADFPAAGGSQYGGIAGSLNQSGGKKLSVELCANYGHFTAPRSNVGGIVGQAGGARAGGAEYLLTVTRCVNYGKMRWSERSTGGNQGGILGYCTNAPSLLVKECFNFGSILTNASNVSNNIGGIAGNVVSSEATLERCVNSAKIIARAEGLGGIAGSSGGSIVSCQNTAVNPLGNADRSKWSGAMREVFMAYGPTVEYQPLTLRADEVQIFGHSNVGGIVGVNTSQSGVGVAAVVYTDNSLSDGYTVTKNTMNVGASWFNDNRNNFGIGGIVGKNEGGTVMGAVNSGTIFLNSNWKRSVGGIVGILKSSDRSASTVAGCVALGSIENLSGANVGNLSELDLYTSCGTNLQGSADRLFRGGVVGARADGAGTHMVTDSFYLEFRVPETTLGVGEIINDGSQVSQADPKYTGRWRVGNEPYDSAAGEKGGQLDGFRDGEGNILSALENGLSLAELYGDGRFPTFSKWEGGSESQRLGAAEQFAKNYSYQLPAPTEVILSCDPASGAGYTVSWKSSTSLAQGYTLVVNLFRPESDSPEKTLTVQTEIDPAKTSFSFDLPREYVGYRFTAQMVAEGKLLQNGSYITVDSELSPESNALNILPPLPVPQVKWVKHEAPEGQESSRVTYTAELTNPADYGADPRADFPILQGVTDERRLQYGAYRQGVASYTLRVDGRTFELKPDARDGYTAEVSFELGTKPSVNYDYTVTADPAALSGSALAPPYAYVVGAGRGVVTATQKLQLESPALTLSYTGTTSAVKYRAGWNPVENARSYRVTVLDQEDNVLLEKTATGSSYDFSLEESLYGTACTVWVQAVGDGATYADSDISQLPFKVPQRLAPPEITFAREGDVYTVSWSGADTFDAAVHLDGAEKFRAVGTGETAFVLRDLVNQAIDGDLELTAAVTARGTLGVSLDSQPGTSSRTIYHRLGTVSVSDAAQTASNRFKVTWESPDAAGDNCGGFVLYYWNEALRGDVVLAEVADPNARSTALTVPDSLLGQAQVRFCVVALGREGVTSDSLGGNYHTVNTAGRLSPPAGLKVELPEGYPADPETGVSQEEFQTLSYTGRWSPVQNASSYVLQVLDETGTPVALERDGEGNPTRTLTGTVSGTSWSFTVPEEYAGQTLTVQVSARSLSQFPSEWAGCTVLMPKIEEPQPSEAPSPGPSAEAARLWLRRLFGAI